VIETKSENSVENLVDKKRYCFKISLKSSTDTIDKLLMTKLESSHDFARIRQIFDKTGGTMSFFYSELEGTMGVKYIFSSK
jgi:hypothetical protein